MKLADAVWIGSSHPFDLFEAYQSFRSPLYEFDRMPKKAELFITADSRYKLWVNGQFVARGPARSYPQQQSVDRLDLTKYLNPGANLLAVQVYQPGYSHFAYLHRGASGLLASLVCDGEVKLVTDLNWRSKRDLSFKETVPRVSIYGTGIEVRDMQLVEDWMLPDFDASDWQAPRLVAAQGGYPWLSLKERELPLLIEDERNLQLLETQQGKTSAKTDVHFALREGWFAATQQNLNFDAAGWFNITLDNHESAYWLFDLGRDYSCQGFAEVENAAGTETLVLTYQEKIRDGQVVISDPQTYCRVRITDSFHLRVGTQRLESFAMRGGRYLLFELKGPCSRLRLRMGARAQEYPLELTKPLETRDAELAGIITLCEETFKACLQDGFVDSTWRESSLWLGDALPQSLIMLSLGNDTRPIKQVIEMAAQGAYPDGVLPSILPGEVHAYAVIDYNFSWVELLRLYFDSAQDKAFVKAMWPVLCRMLERFHEDIQSDGLIRSQPGRRLFLDWSPQSRKEPNAVYNLRYLYALQNAASLVDEHKPITDEALMWRDRAALLQKAIRQYFWQDGRCYDDLERSSFSQLAAALAVLTETARASEVSKLLTDLVVRSLDLDDNPAANKMTLASPFMHHYVFEALRKHGRDDEVLAIIRARWGRWVKAGYPTTWENWNVDFPDGSQCHAFSAHPRYHLAEIAKARGGL